MTLFIFIYLLAMVCWLGGVVFFSFFTAPAVFGNLPIAEAGKVISTVFPRYYILGYCAGTVALIATIYFVATAPYARGWWLGTALAVAIALGCTFYAGVVVRPRVEAIRSVAEQATPDPVQKAEFDRLHKLSVMLNGAVLLLDIVALLETAAALSPRV